MHNLCTCMCIGWVCIREVLCHSIVWLYPYPVTRILMSYWLDRILHTIYNADFLTDFPRMLRDVENSKVVPKPPETKSSHIGIAVCRQGRTYKDYNPHSYMYIPVYLFFTYVCTHWSEINDRYAIINFIWSYSSIYSTHCINACYDSA